jgi:hypothetical protein
MFRIVVLEDSDNVDAIDATDKTTALAGTHKVVAEADLVAKYSADRKTVHIMKSRDASAHETMYADQFGDYLKERVEDRQALAV